MILPAFSAWSMAKTSESSCSSMVERGAGRVQDAGRQVEALARTFR